MSINVSVTRVADRKAMVDIVRDILTGVVGGVVESREPTGRCRALDFWCPKGLSVTIKFDGDNKQNREGLFLLAWHTQSRLLDGCHIKCLARYSEAFGVAMRAPINQYHFGKCTAVAHDFDDLCARLRRAVWMINDGTAYRI